MDDSDISDVWTSDSNIWLVSESYIVGASEYVWCVTVVHKVFYISNVSLKRTTNSTRIYMSKNTLNNFSATHSILFYKDKIPEQLKW